APLHRVLQLAHRGPPARFRRGGPFFTLPPKRAADHGHGGGVLRSHGLSEGDAGASATQPGKDASRLSLALPQWGGRSGQKSPLPNTLYLLRVGQFLSVGVDQFPSVANITSRSIETDGSLASMFATLDWLDLILLATATWLNPKD